MVPSYQIKTSGALISYKNGEIKKDFLNLKCEFSQSEDALIYPSTATK